VSKRALKASDGVDGWSPVAKSDVRNGKIVAPAGVFARRKKFQSSPFIPKTIAEWA
jgi:hypothetical protein